MVSASDSTIMAMFFRTSVGLGSFLLFGVLFFFAVFFAVFFSAVLLFAFFFAIGPFSDSLGFVKRRPKSRGCALMVRPLQKISCFLTLYIPNIKLLRVKWTFPELYI